MNLGFIEKSKRTKVQENAHDDAMGKMVRFSLPAMTLAKGEGIFLYKAYEHPEVVADVGFTFTYSHQFTGSCVNSGGQNAVFSTIATQRLASDKPTKAFMPFTLHNYAMSRHYFGEDGQGEGSLGSTFAKSLTTDGIRDWDVNAGLPQYSRDNGIGVSGSVEMTWSSYRYSGVAKVIEVSKAHLFGSATEAHTPQDIQNLITNGYGVSFACNNYIGNGSIRGTGANAMVMGKWNGQGGHQQSINAVYNHPDFGMVYRAQNNWDKNTYPADPFGSPLCGVWVTEADVAAAMRLDSEVYGYSHLPWFEAMPRVREVVSWVM